MIVDQGLNRLPYHISDGKAQFTGSLFEFIFEKKGHRPHKVQRDVGMFWKYHHVAFEKGREPRLQEFLNIHL